MGRSFKRKTNKGSFTKDSMQDAVNLVINEKESLRDAADACGLKFQTLHSGKLIINIICEFQFKMDVFMMIQRKNVTMFIDAKDNTLVNELKRMIGCIIKLEPSFQQLYYKDEIMDGEKTLIECGLDFNFAKAHTPALIGLALKLDNGEFEPLEITSYSKPPELPYVMRNHEDDNQESSM